MGERLARTQTFDYTRSFVGEDGGRDVEVWKVRSMLTLSCMEG